jgi:hypothetical protein
LVLGGDTTVAATFGPADEDEGSGSGGSGPSPGGPIDQSQAAVSGPGSSSHKSPDGIAVAGGVAASKGGSVSLNLQCPAGGTCSGVLKLIAEVPSGPVTKRHGKRHPSRRDRWTKRKRGVVIGKHAFSIAAGHSATVKVPLNTKGMAMLRHAGKHGLIVRLTGTGVKGRTIHLKPKRHGG